MRQFGAEHIAALAVTAVAAAALVALARRRGREWAVPVARALAVLIAAAYVTDHVTYALRGMWTVSVNLPLQLTDAVTAVSVVALWFPRAALPLELLYFWAYSASLQAVITPDLAQPFPDLLYFTYFGTHSGALVAASLLVFGCGRLPRPGAVWRVYGLTVAFACLAALGTVLTGGNYMFLRRKPASGSLLDVMGPWPWYILSGAVLALAMFVALDALSRRAGGGRTPRARGRSGSGPARRCGSRRCAPRRAG